MKLLKYYFIVIISIVLNGCGPNLTYEEQMNSYKENYNKAVTFFDANHFRTAINYADRCISITDTLSVAYYIKGEALLELGELKESEATFDIIIDLEGSKSRAYKNRALVYFRMNDSNFIDDINNYLENYPNDEEAGVLKRTYYESNESFNKAIQEYNIAIEKDNQNVDLYIKRSILFFKNKDFKEALLDCNTISQLSPENLDNIKRKNELEQILYKNNNRNKLLISLGVVYLLYVLLSFFVLKPLVLKKSNLLGGEIILGKDPLIWLLPIVLLFFFIIVNKFNYILTF
ncbi:hypothetical protein HCG49_02345 [Arenibacter sp. 6A1]|uniref:tetratricopeptide repeat protein n=1 Tax=Arenibacter sp. 6A1 TaxID=2720391 RepID=UPI001444E5CC|nr:hypothetical protein [Arenibacter sp. 6A1]NKI25397.1 hypothetical protein [Arenibacter sp. 6A1]